MTARKHNNQVLTWIYAGLNNIVLRLLKNHVTRKQVQYFI